MSLLIDGSALGRNYETIIVTDDALQKVIDDRCIFLSGLRRLGDGRGACRRALWSHILLLATYVFAKADFSRNNHSKNKDADIWS